MYVFMYTHVCLFVCMFAYTIYMYICNRVVPRTGLYRLFYYKVITI